MQINHLNIDDITPYDNNPRLNDGAVDRLAQAIREFGFQQPLVVDQHHVIVVGHTRLKAARKLGLTTVPVVAAAVNSPEQVKAYRIADNQLNTLADWDEDKLTIEIQELIDVDYDPSVLAFDDEFLARLIDPASFDGQTDPDAVPETPEEPDSQVGTIYELGRHRLLVGDATDADSMQELMGADRAHLLLTDPPYNVAYIGKTADALTIDNDQMDDVAFRTFLVDSLRATDCVMAPGAAFYIWHADSEGFNFRGACREVGWPVRQCLIWSKDVMVMGRQDYHWQHEPCLYGWKPGAKHQWQSDRKQTTLLEFARPKRNTEHPTMKPVDLFEYQIRNSSRLEQIVLDPFGGSGTTVIACERSGRAARTLELDPRYADVIRRRWAQYVHGDDCDWQSLTPSMGVPQ